ncbi:lymphoid-specific helicase-like isoform X2 [Adelges cooleyi]|uniref:lymphoid-specific helicase-like isoform X2 n=1 Tax=Adelges cooleyi TaxID=133065 RepID=UPI0021801B37|nr:lymphoid-specific helicase-like isoform X2 [Adelges cooleyi]
MSNMESNRSLIKSSTKDYDTVKVKIENEDSGLDCITTDTNMTEPNMENCINENQSVNYNENENDDSGLDNITSSNITTNLIDNSFLPKEMLIEEQRLREEHRQEDDAMVDDLDEQEKQKRFQNLLTLLENSTKLTDIFETRLKKCKLQIIKKEIQAKKKADKMKENLPSNNKLNEDKKTITDNFVEEEYYLSLFKQPKLFHGTLKSHQVEGLLWIRTLFENGLNGILADDMGLGKTIQTIAFYCFLIEMGIKGPFLVIAPLSTIPNWLSEFVKFSPELPTVLYHGTEDKRKDARPLIKKTQKVNNMNCFPVIITTYDVMRTDVNFLATIDWKYITVDEGHKLKNFNAQVSKAMRKFSCANKLILTGTPIQNDMSELWSLLNLLMPKLFNKLEDFNSWFVIEDFFSDNHKIANMAKKNEILDIIQKVIKPFILRREKKETDLNLPPKKEIVVYAPITEKQQELYMATLQKHMEVLLNKEKEDSNIIEGPRPKRKCVESIIEYTDMLAIKTDPKEEEVPIREVALSIVMQNPVMQLKKIANHPYLVHMPLIKGTEQILVDENIVKVSGKFQVLDAMLTKLKLLGHKVLLFSTMTQLLDVIEEFMIYRSHKYTRLDGTMQIEGRVEAMRIFNTDPEYFIMLISTRAGGLGLNLTSADTVIIFDSDWNPQVDLQAQDRCHRMGQEKPVVVYRLCCKNTIDEKILTRATAKRKLEKIVIGSGTFNNRSSKLSLTSIEELLTLLESSDYNKKIQSNGFIFTDEELDALLDRSDLMIEATSKTTTSKPVGHFKVVSSS